MSHLLWNRLLLCIALIATPLLAAGQSNIDYSFSSAHLCTLDDAGQTDCVLASGYERLKPPTSLPVLTALTTGEAHACAITADGQPICWGDNFFGQLNTPVVDGVLIQIDAGANHTCALDTNGEATCWGLNTNLQLRPPVGVTFTQVDAAAVASCGLLTDGDVVCWSDDPRFSLQNFAGPFVKIDIRSGAVCGLTEDGRIRCTDSSAITPINYTGPSFITPPDNGPYIDIAVSENAVCGLRTDGALDCAFTSPEDGNDYPLGEQFSSIQSNETDIILRTPEIVNGSFTTAVSGTTMCGERFDGTLQCWDQGDVFPMINGPAALNAEFVASFELELDARIYTSDSLEIFWTPIENRDRPEETLQPPLVEVFRNGELLASGRARFSFYDPSAVTDAEYQIRLVDEAGNPGPLSGILSVNTREGTVLFNGEPTLTRRGLEPLPDVFTDVYSSGFSDIVLAWTVEPELESIIDGYAIRVNGQSVGFTRSQLFVNRNNADIIDSICVEITAIGFDGSRLGTRLVGDRCN